MNKRWTWVFAVLFLLVCTAFFTKGLWPVDETRYAEVGREVLTQDSIFLLTKNAEPYSHKPPLYPWLMALGYAVFGVHDWIPKVIPMLFSLGCVWAGSLLYQDLYGERVPGLYKIVLLSSLYYFLFSFYAMFDVMLTFWVLLASHFYLTGRLQWYWMMLGLGILTKGPVILIVAGLPVLVHLVQTKGWKSLKPSRTFWAGFGIMLAVVAVWLVPLLLSAEANFIAELLVKQNFGRMAGAGSWAHERPVYWYLLLYPVLAGPWALLWYANGLSRRFRQETGDGFIYGFILANIVAFSLISGKQMHYLIPTIPFLAMWIARHQAELFATIPTKILVKLYGVLWLAGGIVFIWFGGGMRGLWGLSDSVLRGLEGTPPLVNPNSLISTAWLPAGIIFTGLGLYGILRKLAGEGRLVWLSTGAVVFLAWLTLILVPTADQVMSPKALSEEIGRLVRQGETVAVFDRGTYDANLNFYAEVDHFPVVTSEEEAEEYLARPDWPLLIVGEESPLLATENYEVVGAGWNFGYKEYIIRRKN